MPSYTVKGISNALLDRLRNSAAENRRSLNQEIIRLLEDSVGPEGEGSVSPGWASPDWHEFARQADLLRERLRQRHGTLPDSTVLIRDARDDR